MTVSYLEMLSQEVNGKNAFRQLLMASVDKEAMLRELARQSMDAFRKRFTRPETDELVLGTFEIVGGVLVDLKSSSIDNIRFYDMLIYLIKSGVPIRPDFTVHTSNFLNDIDYLKTTTQADVTLISYVPLATREMKDVGYDVLDLSNPTIAFLRAKEEFAQARDNPGSIKSAVGAASEVNRTVSNLNTIENWRERLGLSGSKLIFSIFSGLEVHLGDVMPKGYRSLGALDKYDTFRDPTRVNDIAPHSGVNWQVIGSEDYIEMAMYIARPDTDLDTGERIADASKRGTQLGTHIVEAVHQMFDEEGARELTREREAAAKRPKPQAPNTPKSDEQKP